MLFYIRSHQGEKGIVNRHYPVTSLEDEQYEMVDMRVEYVPAYIKSTVDEAGESVNKKIHGKVYIVDEKGKNIFLGSHMAVLSTRVIDGIFMALSSLKEDTDSAVINQRFFTTVKGEVVPRRIVLADFGERLAQAKYRLLMNGIAQALNFTETNPEPEKSFNPWLEGKKKKQYKKPAKTNAAEKPEIVKIELVSAVVSGKGEEPTPKDGDVVIKLNTVEVKKKPEPEVASPSVKATAESLQLLAERFNGVR